MRGNWMESTKTNFKNELKSAASLILTFSLPFLQRYQNHRNAPPVQINCKIQSTDAALKGQTVSSSYKPAILDNGVKIQVPPFIESGDEIIVDTRSIEYIKKL